MFGQFFYKNFKKIKKSIKLQLTRSYMGEHIQINLL